MFTQAGRNQLLDATTITHVSLHTAYPGESGTSEVSGGSPAYARQSVTWAASSSGNKVSNNAQAFDVPAAVSVNWLGFWTALTSGTFLATSPNGANPKRYALSLASANTIGAVNHGYTANQPVVFYSDTPPSGLTAGTTYYVVGATVTTDTFQVSAAPSGAAIALTGQPGNAAVVSSIVTESFGAQGTFTVNAGSATLNLNY